MTVAIIGAFGRIEEGDTLRLASEGERIVAYKKSGEEVGVVSLSGFYNTDSADRLKSIGSTVYCRVSQKHGIAHIADIILPAGFIASRLARQAWE